MAMMLLPGCCVIGESMTMFQCSSVMFPVPLCMEFKVCLLLFKSLHGAVPRYLCDYCKETYSSASRLQRRSTCKTDENSVWRLHPLSCWSHMLEQTYFCSACGRFNQLL